MLLEEFDEEKAIKNWNYTVNKLQTEIEQYRSENDRFRSENRNNIIQTVSLLRELGKNEDFIIQTLIEKYNISKDSVSDYL